MDIITVAFVSGVYIGAVLTYLIIVIGEKI
jgi:hypothetical protein